MTTQRHDQQLANRLYRSERMKRNQAAVNRMTTERDRRFVEAYYFLSLQARWGRLDPDKEREYLARG